MAAVTPKILEHLHYFIFFAYNMRAFQVYVNSLQKESSAGDFSQEVFKLKFRTSITAKQVKVKGTLVIK